MVFFEELATALRGDCVTTVQELMSDFHHLKYSSHFLI